MKKLLKVNLLALLAAGIFNSCSDDDKLGYAKIYMPQAVILDGGITNNYPVPLNNNAVTKNYSIADDGTLHVTLGVYRSGLQEMLSYNVKVTTDLNATEAAVASLSGRVELPDGYWKLPSTVTVPADEREALFSLDVDIPRLGEDYPEYYNNKLVLAVNISEPSRYELNPDLCTAIVIIDGSVFMPAPETPPAPPGPELVVGGQFRDEDAVFWNYANIKNAGFDEGYMVIADGKLTIRAEGNYDELLAEYWTELDQELTPGATYTFTMDVATDGNASSAELNIGLAPEHSDDWYRYPIKNGAEGGGLAYKDYFFASLHTWNDPMQLSAPFNGTLPQDAGYVYGFQTGSAEFVAEENQRFLCIQFCTWGGSMGVITIENISIREKR